jgi:Skp family chaperone for outer membrane proteins
MRSLLRILFPAVLLLAFSGVPALAQTKIATVDLKTLFDNYYKTKLATDAIQERADDLQKDYTGMANDLKTRNDQYEQTLESADDPAVSDDERARRKQAAADQLKQLQDSKLAIDQFQRQAEVTLTDQKQRMRDNILADIKKVVAEKAKAAGDTLVLDTDAQTVDGTPVIVYGTGDNDLTDDVLKELNASAPLDMPDTTTTPVFMSTNSPPYNALPGTTPANP